MIGVVEINALSSASKKKPRKQRSRQNRMSSELKQYQIELDLLYEQLEKCFSIEEHEFENDCEAKYAYWNLNVVWKTITTTTMGFLRTVYQNSKDERKYVKNISNMKNFIW